MDTLDERVSYLEGRVEEHSRSVGELRELILAVDQRVTAVDQRVTALDQKMDRRFDALEQRVDRRFEAIEARFSTVITIQMTTLLTIAAGLIGIIGTMLHR
ncbi:MAG: hypothetical protein HYZ58_18500 [Acidobacteria bacterium]|nr:hypothetical protein [Acidobacteriota bacterium]